MVGETELFSFSVQDVDMNTGDAMFIAKLKQLHVLPATSANNATIEVMQMKR
jgi:hypothetical protein